MVLPWDPCHEYQCLNEGTCHVNEDSQQPICVCTPQFTGQYCEQSTDLSFACYEFGLCKPFGPYLFGLGITTFICFTILLVHFAVQFCCMLCRFLFHSSTPFEFVRSPTTSQSNHVRFANQRKKNVHCVSVNLHPSRIPRSSKLLKPLKLLDSRNHSRYLINLKYFSLSRHISRPYKNRRSLGPVNGALHSMEMIEQNNPTYCHGEMTFHRQNVFRLIELKSRSSPFNSAVEKAHCFRLDEEYSNSYSSYCTDITKMVYYPQSDFNESIQHSYNQRQYQDDCSYIRMGPVDSRHSTNPLVSPPAKARQTQREILSEFPSLKQYIDTFPLDKLSSSSAPNSSSSYASQMEETLFHAKTIHKWIGKPVTPCLQSAVVCECTEQTTYPQLLQERRSICHMCSCFRSTNRLWTLPHHGLTEQNTEPPYLPTFKTSQANNSSDTYENSHIHTTNIN